MYILLQYFVCGDALLTRRLCFHVRDYNCDVQGGQYPYAEQDHLALRHLAFKNFVRPRTLGGDTVYKPVDVRI